MQPFLQYFFGADEAKSTKQGEMERMTGVDSRRTAPAVIRRENSSTGRVFYTAPTSTPVAHTTQKHPRKTGVFSLGADDGS